MSNVNADRWIFSSISKWFDTHKGSLTLYIDGQTIKDQVSDYIELSISGPQSNEINLGFWRYECFIRVLIQSIITNDYHKPYTNIGLVNSMFAKIIPVIKYGTGVVDDKTTFGLLTLFRNAQGSEAVQTMNYGFIDKSLRIQQATVEARYEMFVTDNS